jgi:hypothetical protein
MAAEVEHPVEDVADQRRRAVGERDRDRDRQPLLAVEEAEQPQVDAERAEVDQQVAEHVRLDDLRQPERQPTGDRRHRGRIARSVCHGLHCAALAALLGRRIRLAVAAGDRPGTGCEIVRHSL